MYHDQGLIPLKLHAFYEGVNVTLGLPFPRTSPDHGTAFEIAGKGIARPDSMIAAIKLAVELATESETGSMTSRQKYLTVFNLGIQNTFVYRWNYFLRALFGLIPLAGTVFLWRAIFQERGGGLHGYDYGSMIYYYLLTLLVSNLVTPTEDEWQIASDIREGQINSFLTKPMSYLAYRFSIFLSGRLVYHRGHDSADRAHLSLLPQLTSRCPPNLTTYICAFISLLMAAFIQFFITYSLAMMAFWILEISTIVFIVYSFEYFLGGQMFPIDIMPAERAGGDEMAAVLL